MKFALIVPQDLQIQRSGEKSYYNAYSALTDDNKTIDDFASGLNKNNSGHKWGTNTEMMKIIFKGVVKDYEKDLTSRIEVNGNKISENNKIIDSKESSFIEKVIAGGSNLLLKASNQQLNSDLKELQVFKKNEGIK